MPGSSKRIYRPIGRTRGVLLGPVLALAVLGFGCRQAEDKTGKGTPPPAGKPAPQTATWRRELKTDEAVLFRYSALIFNAHRIHYDIDYCRDEEGYPGLIVHGPLQTTLLLDLCRRSDPRPVRTLDYRATHPIFHQETFSVNGQPSADGKSVELWTANAAGSYAMRGTATFC